MTLTDEMTRTHWLVRAAARDGVEPHQRLQAARAAAEEIQVTRPARLDPIAVPFDAATRQRVAPLRDVPTLHVARDPRDVIGDAPPCARTVGVEAYRRQVDAMALDPSHGIAQAEAIREERRKAGVTAMADELRLCGAIDGPPHLRESIAALLWARLQAEGVL